MKSLFLYQKLIYNIPSTLINYSSLEEGKNGVKCEKLS